GILAILRAAVVLPERGQHAAALRFAFAAVALQPLDIAERAVEVGAHLLDLIVERAALRRLSAEHREEAAALAAVSLRLLAQAVHPRLLLAGGIFQAFALVGLGGIGGAAVDRGELAFEPQAGLAALPGGRVIAGGRRVGAAGRKQELRACRRRA